MSQQRERNPSSAGRTWRYTGRRWWARRRHVLAGFWQKSAGWALPPDQRGEGYLQLARQNSPQLGFCLLFVFASSWGQTFLLSIFQPHWIRALQLDPADIGLIYGAATLASGLMLPWAGRWLDRESPGYTGTVTLLGLAAFSTMMALATGPLLLGVALFGLRFFGQGLSANVGTVNAARWFHHNRGKAISFAALGFPLGEAVLPLLVTFAAFGFGWRATWAGLAVVCVVVFMPLTRWLAARHPPIGGSPADEEGDEDREEEAAAESRRSILRDRRFYAMLGMMAPLPFVTTGIIFFQATLAEERDWSGAIFATGFAAFAIVRALCSLPAGAWVDRLGAVRLLAVPSFASAAGLAFLMRPEPVFAYLFFVGIGIAFGSSGAITTAAWAEMFGTEYIGTIRAMSSSFAIFVTAAAPMCFGVILNRGVPPEALILGSALLMLGMAWPFSVVVRRLHLGRTAAEAGGATGSR
jgi:MFS family permease